MATNAKIRRDTLCCIWYGEHADLDRLRADKGIDVESTGWWNVETGVAFVDAKIKRGDKTLETVDVTYSLDGYTFPEGDKPQLIVCANDGGKTEINGVPVINLTPYMHAEFVGLLELLSQSD